MVWINLRIGILPNSPAHFICKQKKYLDVYYTDFQEESNGGGNFSIEPSEIPKKRRNIILPDVQPKSCRQIRVPREKLLLVGISHVVPDI